MNQEKNNSPHIKPEIRESMKNLGFTEYFINIYVGLLEKGELNAHDLSELTGVPYSRIYEVLNDMIKRGIITKVDGRPSTFLANEPPEVFKFIKQKQEDDFNTRMNECLPFFCQLFGKKTTVKTAQVTIIQGDHSGRDHLRNIINASARTLYAALSDVEALYPIIKMNLDFLRTKNVQVRLILEEKFKDCPFISELRGYGKLRFLPRLDQDILISDDKTGLQAMRGHFNFTKPSEREYCIINATESLFVFFIAEMFTNLWDLAKD